MIKPVKATGIDELRELVGAMRREIAKVIVGQERVVEEVLIALFCRGHAIIVGVPGLAKTLMVSTVAQVLDLGFKRVQFTPDLMPSDITGTDVLEDDPATKERRLRFIPGPVFTNLLLADEINRTPPKTQSALLQAMQEYAVTYNGVNHPLPKPFFVLATRNPIEQEGTYVLAEAQLDRFLFEIAIKYPTVEEELEIVRRTTKPRDSAASKILTADDVERFQELVRAVPVAEHLEKMAVDLARRTRPENIGAPAAVKDFVSWGAGPRAAQALTLAAKARALLEGRNAPSREDLECVAYPALRHRIILNFKAHSQNISPEGIIKEVVSGIEM